MIVSMGYIKENARGNKKVYRMLSKKANYGKTESEIRRFITYPCVAHIGINLSKSSGKFLQILLSGGEKLNFVKQVSKELFLKNCAYHPLAVALNTFTKNKVSKEKIKLKLFAKP